MKVAIVDGKKSPVISNVPEPKIQSPYDVICENIYCATCTGTDLHLIRGTFPHPIIYPSILGHEGVGRVIEVGSKVRAFKIGDLITRVGAPETEELSVCWGGISEFGVARDHFTMRMDGLPESEYSAYKVNWHVPDGIISEIDATMIITWRENLSYVMRLGISAGSRVLISGSGASGLGLARMAVLQGAGYVCLVGGKARKKNAESLGISEYLDYRDQDALDSYANDNEGTLDFIIDANGINGCLNVFMPCIRRGGTFACYGKDDWLNYAIPPFFGKTSFNFYNNGYDVYEAHIPVLDYIRSGKLDAKAWIDDDQIFTIDQTSEAYSHVEEKKAVKSIIKIKG